MDHDLRARRHHRGPHRLTTRAERIAAAVLSNPEDRRAFLILGNSGSGKTRLLQQVGQRLRDKGLGVTWDLGSLEPHIDVLLVDDLDLRPDGDLERLIDVTDRRSLHVIATARPRRRRTLLRNVGSALTRDEPACRLEPASRAEVDAEISSISQRVDRDTLDTVLAKTGGNPCLVDIALATLGDDDCAARITGAISAEVHARLTTMTEQEVMALAILTLGVEVGTTDLAAVLDLDYDAAAEVIDRVRCSGFIDVTPDLEATVHRLCVAVLGRRRTTAIERELEAVIGRDEPVPELLSERLWADGIERSVDSRLDLLVERIRRGDTSHVDSTLDGLWSVVDDNQRVRAVDVATTVAALRGDTARASAVVAWALGEQACTEADAATLARWAVVEAAAGRPDALAQYATDDPTTPVVGPHTAAMVDLHVAIGVASSMRENNRRAVQTLIRAARVERDCSATRVTIDSAAAIAALLAMHTGQLHSARAVLTRAPEDALPQPHRSRHRILLAWVTLFEGDVDGAAAVVESRGSEPLQLRDDVALGALRVAIARRRGDHAEIGLALSRITDAIAEYNVDLFSLLFIGELWVAAAQTENIDAFTPAIESMIALAERCGPSSQWSAAIHWYGVHAAIAANSPDSLIPHARALSEAGRSNPQAAMFALAGKVWVEVLAGEVSPDRVDHAARQLDAHGYSWDAACLAGQAALKAADPAVTSRMLHLARSLRTHPIADSAPTSQHSSVGVLSERERQVSELLLTGITYRDIGARLFISAKTVEHHVARIRRRLGAQTRSEMLTMLREMQLGSTLAM